MEAQFKEDKRIESLNVGAPAGSFALEKNPFYFETCRERFAPTWNERTVGFFFKTENNGGRNVAQFITKTEVIVNETDHSKFACTNWLDILWVEPSKFWKKCRLRRSLFTILLRAGLAYRSDVDNYEEALFHERYLVDTPVAIRRFMFGYTKYVGPPPAGSTTLETCGWRSLFMGKDAVYCKTVLRPPRKKPCSVGCDLADALWI